MGGPAYTAAEIQDAYLTVAALIRAFNHSPDPSAETEEITVLLDNCDLRAVARMLVGAFHQSVVQYAALFGEQDPHAAIDRVVQGLLVREREEAPGAQG